MSKENIESKLVVIPGVGQFLVKVKEGKRNQPIGRREIGFHSTLKEKSIDHQPDIDPRTEMAIRKYLGLPTDDEKPSMGFISDVGEAYKKPRELQITPIQHLYLPGVNYKNKK